MSPSYAAADQPRLIAIDWGTSSFRAYLVTARQSVCETRQSPRGILSVEGGRFADVLTEAIRPWVASYGALPVLMSGMIGSRQGWREASYVECPARLADIAKGLVLIDATEPREAPGVPAYVAIVPGVAARSRAGLPDVMRGEETQVLGAMARHGLADASFVLPGTHSKWVAIADGAITGFATYMTGEVFAALKDHTILRRLMAPARMASGPASGASAATGVGFARGLETANRAMGLGPGALLQLVFSARTLALFSELAPDEIADYLSGILIGAEVRQAAGTSNLVWIVGQNALAERYAVACRAFGIEPRIAAADCAAAGLAAIARTVGLFGDTT